MIGKAARNLTSIRSGNTRFCTNMSCNISWSGANIRINHAFDSQLLMASLVPDDMLEAVQARH